MESDGEDIPLIASYALTDGETFSVFILSRKLDGVHDNVDFGDGYTPVTLRLPFTAVQQITRYRLERPDGTPVDPRANNRDGWEVVIGAREIDPAHFAPAFVLNANTGAEAGGIPPGGIYLYVFRTDGGGGCIPDQDGDGDVDGSDLASFAWEMEPACLAAMAGDYGSER